MTVESETGHRLKCISHLIDVTENDLFDGIVLQNFTYNATVTPTDYKNLLWVRVACKR